MRKGKAKAGKEVSSSRTWIFFLVAFVVLCLFIARAFYLQVINSKQFEERGKKRYERLEKVGSLRGSIIDRHGEMLAVSTHARSIWLDKNIFVKSTSEQRKALAELLKVPLAKVNRGVKKSGYIKKNVALNTVLRIKKLHIPGIAYDPASRRLYNGSDSMTSLLGFVNAQNNGQSGLEQAWNKVLVPKDQKVKVIKDSKGRVREKVEVLQAGKSGATLRLTIDSNVQYQAYRQIKHSVDRLQANAGQAILLDSRNGDILALVNYKRPQAKKKQKKGMHWRRKQFRNSIFLDTFEPGSIIKPIAAAAILESKAASYNTKVYTGNGRLTLGGYTITDDVHGKGSGDMTLAEVLERSSNVGISKLTARISSQKMWQTYRNFGLGQKIHLHYPGLPTGTLRDYTEWRPLDKAALSYGYGTSTSLATIAQAYTAFANDGVMHPLHLVKSVGMKEVSRLAPIAVISPNNARQVRGILELATSNSGTGANARIAGYRVAGKTGTARRFSRGRYVRKYYSSFVGMAPASAPRFVLAILIDAPKGVYYGSQIAAPIFSKVMKFALQLYNVVPDDSESLAPTRTVKAQKILPAVVHSVNSLLAQK